jgi:hypothetical protein
VYYAPTRRLDWAAEDGSRNGRRRTQGQEWLSVELSASGLRPAHAQGNLSIQLDLPINARTGRANAGEGWMHEEVSS